MSEQRLINANDIELGHIVHDMGGYTDLSDVGDYLNTIPTIDPETLPIVQHLRDVASARGKVIEKREKTIEELREKLARYEQAEAEGKLVKLPCKVGDTINVFRWNEETKKIFIISDKVTSLTYNKNGYTVKTKSKFYPIKEKDGYYSFAPVSEYPYAFADYWIGSIEEAEAILKERRNNYERMD